MTESPPPYPGINGYSQQPGAAGATAGAGGFVGAGPTAPSMSSGDAKAAEAAASANGGQIQTGYYDPSNPGAAFLPYNEQPPSYDDSQKKNK
jgi:hypothetical protein